MLALVTRFAGNRLAGLALLILTTGFGVVLIAYTVGLGNARADSFVDAWAYDGLVLACGLVCLARGLASGPRRLPWLLLGLGIVAWAIGDMYWTHYLVELEEPPFPSIADAFWLALYPPAYVALVLLARARVSGFRASFWLDGLLGALAVASLGAALVFGVILDATGGERASVVATNLSYPLADLLLIALVIGVLAAAGWRSDRAWTLFALGLLVFSVSDCLFLYQTAVGTYAAGTPVDLGWLGGTLLLGWAAWQPSGRALGARLDGWWVLVPPIVFAAIGLGILVYDHFTRVNTLALVLATAALVGIIGRLALTFRENLTMLAKSRYEALTDPLTGLGNRRKLVLDLDAEPSRRRVLVLFDLNGFKHYNDTFGHPAGDSLLARLGRNLASYAGGRGEAYRMGGDEFCLFADIAGEPGELLAETGAAALAETGDGFSISSAYGWVITPDESTDATTLMRLADTRLYANKHARLGSAREQSSNVLVHALAARHPELSEHLAGVAELATAVARELEMTGSDLEELKVAAALHDVGKMAVPDAILHKPGALDSDEWEFVHRHTTIGEKILQAAPALASAGELVRHSHERFDGRGYPDGIAGTDIALGARVIFVCDAFDAMVSARPYSRRMSDDEALAELERCAGTQFDPVVVQAFKHVLERRKQSAEKTADTAAA